MTNGDKSIIDFILDGDRRDKRLKNALRSRKKKESELRWLIVVCTFRTDSRYGGGHPFFSSRMIFVRTFVLFVVSAGPVRRPT